MKTHLLSYEEALNLTTIGDEVFYEKVFMVNGFKISIFNYRIAQYSDFVNPLGDGSINSYEMRGLTFVFNTDGSLFKRFLLMGKFFNMNQVEETSYDIVKNYKIKNVSNKEDGSIASFFQLPDGTVIGKSKMSIESDQSNYINKIYNTNINIKNFVDWTLENNLNAIFEYVAPHNRIVLRYNTEELVLLKVRNNITGEYLDIETLDYPLEGIKIAATIHNSLDELISLCAHEENIEGYVVHAIDNDGYDFFYKLKTTWYCALHGLLTDDLYREHVLVRYILNEEIDDVIAQIPEEEVEARERIDKMIKVVIHELHKKVAGIDALYDIYLTYGNNKDFALAHRKDENFGYVMNKVRGYETFDIAKKHFLTTYDKLNKTREWLLTLDPSIFEYLIITE